MPKTHNWKKELDVIVATINESSQGIEKSLMEIRPYPSPKIIDPFREEVAQITAGLEIIDVFGDFKNDPVVKKMSKQDRAALTSIPAKTVDALKSLALLRPGNKLLRFCSHLYQLSYKAKENDLHAEID